MSARECEGAKGVRAQGVEGKGCAGGRVQWPCTLVPLCPSTSNFLIPFAPLALNEPLG